MQAEIGAVDRSYDRLGAMFINMLPVDTTEPEGRRGHGAVPRLGRVEFITAHEIAPDSRRHGVLRWPAREVGSRPSPKPSAAPGGSCPRAYLALVVSAEAGVTMNDNVAAFSQLRLRPRVADLLATRDLATTVMGQGGPSRY
jgi:hypothetical protein